MGPCQTLGNCVNPTFLQRISAALRCAQVIRVWARIMAALPSSRLLLKNKPFACESARSHTLGLLAGEARSCTAVCFGI